MLGGPFTDGPIADSPIGLPLSTAARDSLGTVEVGGVASKPGGGAKVGALEGSGSWPAARTVSELSMGVEFTKSSLDQVSEEVELSGAIDSSPGIGCMIGSTMVFKALVE
jgi:hypothetical protein